MKSKTFKITFLSITFFMVFSMFYIGYILNMKDNIADNVLRLHIVGADDTEHEQEIKIKVRDRILANFSEVFKESLSSDSAVEIAKEHKTRIENAANDELMRLGSLERATVEIGKCRFPTKKYENIVLPCGTYTAVNIKIGKAKGQNWWCVMYPPLCITENIITVPDESREKLKISLTEEEYSLITEKNSLDIKIKFKIAEILGEIF